MAGHDATRSSTTEGLPIAPSLGPGLASVLQPREVEPVDRRIVLMSALAVALALAAAAVARLLTWLILLITNVAWYGRLSLEEVGPAGNTLGVVGVLVPVVGALIVGVMARYGSRAIRGHGIPEAMEQVLTNQSRIPARVTFLKPLSSAIAIGTGGPFGAEGPIIATGGAMGSVLGQWFHITADERKTLLASGAAAGMSATFGAPVSAVILAIELLLFEFRPRSVIPVALATTTAAAARWTFEGMGPMFPIPEVVAPDFAAVWVYIFVGAVMGIASVFVTRSVYWIEDQFERLPIHWMWWPAVGAVAVGVAGLIAPKTLGVGYDNITDILNGHMLGAGLALFIVMKFVSWSIALGSGTSGGTLAPLFTIGGGLGALLGVGLHALFPSAALDPRIAALVGMAALFAGSSRALLTSVVFAFECTLQPLGLLPLLGGCTAAYLFSSLLMRTSIMTEKIVRRGVRVPFEYSADFFQRVTTKQVATRPVVGLKASQTVAEVRSWLASGTSDTSHQGYPVIDDEGIALGVLTRRDLLRDGLDPHSPVSSLIHRPPVVVFPDSTLREATDHMVGENIGRLLVVERAAPRKPIGIVTRSDLLRAHAPRLQAELERTGRIRLALPPMWIRWVKPEPPR
ncbi:MAG: chloride channel protein [Myxococcaceae bacterium]